MLRDHGYEVDVVDRLWFGNHLPDDVRVIKRDLFTLQPDDLTPYDQIIFLAGLSNDPMAEYNPARNFIDNGALPSYLAFIAKKAGLKRFIYASSCSVYGYTVDELYDEEAPVTCGYPYGISKLQGERGVLQLHDDRFSTIALRQGTVCGYSPRMRFDLIVNTMYMTAVRDRHIHVNNPAIWRPIIDVRDTATAFVRAVEADESISGVFNVAYDNFTVGAVADIVKDEVGRLLGCSIGIDVDHIRDFRNYKVTCERSRTRLGFLPKYGVADMIASLHTRREEFGDFDQERYYNIRTFKTLEQL